MHTHRFPNERMIVCLCTKSKLLFTSQTKNNFLSPSSSLHLTFSQVNDGVILYDQNKPESVGWSAADSFSFTVSSPPAFLPPHTFTILISYQANEHHDNPQHKTRLLNNAGTDELNLKYSTNPVLFHICCTFFSSTDTLQNRLKYCRQYI